MGLHWLALGWLAALLGAAMLLLLLQGREQGRQVGLLTKQACCSKSCTMGWEVSRSACRFTAAVHSSMLAHTNVTRHMVHIAGMLPETVLGSGKDDKRSLPAAAGLGEATTSAPC